MLPEAPERRPDGVTLVLVLGAGLRPEVLPALCGRARDLATTAGAELVVCDLASATGDAVTVDAIARLKVALEKSGRRARFVHASKELGELLQLMGLDGVVGLEDELTVEPQR